MARIGSFDELLRSGAWFDDSAVVEGWFDDDLIGAAAGGAYTLTCDAGAYTIAGQDASLLRGRVVDAEAGAYAVAGQDASLLKSKVITADAGAYAIAGQDATLVYTPSGTAYTLTCDAGAYTLAGQDATLTYAPAAAYTLVCDAGEYVISGQEAALTFSGGQVADTHDGYWSREWFRLKKREEKPTIAEVAEIVRETPQVMEVVRAEVERKYPEVNYAAVIQNVQLQRFIAKQLIAAAEDEDDLEVMLLLA